MNVNETIDIRSQVSRGP